MASEDGRPDHAVLTDYFEGVVAALNARGVPLGRGLTTSEMASIEEICGVSWPPDLRIFLQHTLPLGGGFPNWRGSRETIRDKISWPIEGICFDIDRNDFWLPSWGPRPKDINAALAMARSSMERAPKLVPVYIHRYLPSEPMEYGNPVMSVHQTDIIYFGNDLPGYFHLEFGVPLPSWARSTPRSIRFWDDIILINSERE